MSGSSQLQPPAELILGAMSILTQKDALGYSSDPTESLESRFQFELCEVLNAERNKSGWSWEREFKYATGALRNKKSISIDLFGMHDDGRHSAAIELKYVPTRRQGNQAPNPLAFPYDLLKDCLKIELLATHHATPVKPDFPGTLSFGYAIGLTNVQRILNGRMKGWSRNYLKALFAEKETTGAGFTLGPCIIESMPQATLDGVVYTNERHHISLGAAWNGKWSNFGDGNFHFIMMSTDFRDKEVKYDHNADDSHYIPFLRPDVRAHALQRTAEIRKMRSGSS
jgi:hypothetical protein